MKYFIEWTVESVLIVIHFPVYVLNIFFMLKTVNNNPTQKHPIILVERWFRHNAFHAFGKWYLEKAGFEVYAVNYTLAKGTFDDAAQDLAKFIDEKKIEHAVLVGISAGAITILTYLQKYDGWHHTYKFISVGGPLKGSTFAQIFPLDKSVRELIPNSEFLNGLYAKDIKNKNRIYSIIARKDNMVPIKYSKIPGVHVIQMDMVGHNLLHTFWLPTYKTIIKIAKS